jgi:hypothetical protein
MPTEKTGYNRLFSKMVYLYKSPTNGPQIAARAAKMAIFRPTSLLSLG